MIGKKYKVRRCQVWHMISLRGGSCRKCVSSSRWIATVFIKAPLKLSKISIYGYPFFSRIRIQIYSLVCRPLWYPSALYPYVHSSRHLFLMINQVISPSRTPISTATKQTHISWFAIHYGLLPIFFRFVFCVPCLRWYCSICVSHRPSKHETLGRGGKKKVRDIRGKKNEREMLGIQRMDPVLFWRGATQQSARHLNCV